MTEFMSTENLNKRYKERKELLGDKLGINEETLELIKKQHERNKHD